MFNFSVEKHDDEVDAMTNLLLGFQQSGMELAVIHTI